MERGRECCEDSKVIDILRLKGFLIRQYSRPSLIRIPLIRTLANSNPTFNDIHLLCGAEYGICSIENVHIY